MTDQEINEVAQAIIDGLDRQGLRPTEALESATVRVLVGEYEWLYTVRGMSPPTIMNALSGITTALEAEGVRPAPSRGQTSRTANANGQDPFGKPPVCPAHGIPMRLSSNQKVWYCSKLIHKDEDTGNKTWCDKKIRVGAA